MRKGCSWFFVIILGMRFGFWEIVREENVYGLEVNLFLIIYYKMLFLCIYKIYKIY